MEWLILKAVVISVLILGCFLMMANLAPCLLSNPQGNDKNDPRKRTADQIRQSITTLIVLLIALVMVLHFWR
ncbi:hypothetical protein [Endozoicomonas atrinae]|uniref:hypothetical protein n=1 Tax=Endozoicomonas atrinae TaxID=1333660 RepID=UPI000824086D|nr:hypothetical protein [Endozoicomonas atrinae]